MPGFQPGGVPPDTDGDIGPNHYVQVVNTSLTVFSRTGTVKMGPSPTGSVFTGFAGACGQSNDGDATVRYDHLADRWVVAQFSLGNGANGPYYQCVAVSTTPDPTGTYARYQYNYNALNDYPKVGLWPDAYYFTFNMFGTTLPGRQGLRDGSRQDARGRRRRDDAVLRRGRELRRPPRRPMSTVTLRRRPVRRTTSSRSIRTPRTRSGSSTSTSRRRRTARSPDRRRSRAASFSPICSGGSSCMTQPTGGSQLASLGDRAMNRSSIAGSPITSRCCSATRSPRAPAADSLVRDPQPGDDADRVPAGHLRARRRIPLDPEHRDGWRRRYRGRCTRCRARRSCRASGIAAHAATDPAGTFGAAREPDRRGNRRRRPDRSPWGDYAALNIDPVDDCTFWATHEYHGANGQRKLAHPHRVVHLAELRLVRAAERDGRDRRAGGHGELSDPDDDLGGCARRP